MFRYIAIFITGLALLMQSAFAETARPETAKYVMGYNGIERIEVWTLRIGPQKDNTALVQIGHVDNKIDQQIFRCKTQPASGGGTSYMAQIDGQSYELIRMKDGTGEVFLPGEPSSRPVRYSDEVSERGNPEHFLTAYLEQSEHTE